MAAEENAFSPSGAYIKILAGQTIDITVRFGGVQIERGVTVSLPQLQHERHVTRWHLCSRLDRYQSRNHSYHDHQRCHHAADRASKGADMDAPRIAQAAITLWQEEAPVAAAPETLAAIVGDDVAGALAALSLVPLS